MSEGVVVVAGGGTRSTAELRALTGLRIVAAVWVLAYHAWLLGPGGAWNRHLEPVRPLLEAGWLGVDLFFVLSGFVLTHRYLEQLGDRLRVRGTASFFLARLARVWPTWMVVTGLFTAWLVLKHVTVGGPHTHELETPTLSVPELLQQVFLVQVWDEQWIGATGPVGTGWSLSAEWLAYLAFPLLVLVLHRLRRAPAAVLALLATAAVLPYAWLSLVRGANEWPWAWSLRIAGGFAAGALACLVVRRVRVTPRVQQLAGAAVACSVAGILVVVWWSTLHIGEFAGVAVVFSPVLVGGLALAQGRIADLLGRPGMVLGGRISFALYLVHMPVFEVWWTLGDAWGAAPDAPAATLLQPLVLVLPLPVAWVVWRYVEEPARRWVLALDRWRPPAAEAPRVGPVLPAARDGRAHTRAAGHGRGTRRRDAPVAANG